MILQPMIGSYMLALSFRWLLNQTSKRNLLRLGSLWCIRCTHAVSMVHFWSLVVIAPTFLLCVMLYRTRRSNTVSPNRKDSDTESFSNVPYLTTRVSSTKDTRISSSTSDYVRCILDQWLSCVLGLIVVALPSFVRYRGSRAPLSTLLSVQIMDGICKKSSPAWHIPWHNVAWVMSAGEAERKKKGIVDNLSLLDKKELFSCLFSLLSVHN
jgi:hypothetical protein